jgi:hypothetical protein
MRIESELEILRQNVLNNKFKNEDLEKIVALLNTIALIGRIDSMEKEKNFLEYVGSENWIGNLNSISRNKLTIIKLISDL